MIIYPIDQETALKIIPKIPQVTIATIGENSLEYKITIINGANAKNTTMIGVISNIATIACSNTVFLSLIISLAISESLGK